MLRLIAALVAVACSGSVAMAAECLPYNTPVSLTGIYSSEDFESPFQAGKMESHDFITLDEPICTLPSDDGFYAGVEAATRIEMWDCTADAPASLRITAAGKLREAVDGHQIGPILIDCGGR